MSEHLREGDVVLREFTPADLALWLSDLPHGRATAGYFVAPSARGRGFAAAALTALTGFAWTMPGLHRIELHIEPWNTASTRTAERLSRCGGPCTS
jgi:RimJ/RimL family protein N-acetyltransferase